MIPLAEKRSMIEEPSSMNGEHKLAAMRLIDELYIEDPTRGTRRYQYELSIKGFSLGRDAIRSIMRLMQIEAIYRKPRTTVIEPAKYKYPYLLRNLKITEPNQVWALDISYIPMKNGFMYLLAIIDIYSRCIVGWSISNTMDADWVVKTLKDAISRCGKPQIINSDQGSQFTSDEYVNFVKSQQTIRISMDGKGRAIDGMKTAHIQPSAIARQYSSIAQRHKFSTKTQSFKSPQTPLLNHQLYLSNK